ncbi:MAG: hypothetical protein KF782_11060 [Labilithrix sp.]|nr:hypothetical protein [Labilithrix sp.]
MSPLDSWVYRERKQLAHGGSLLRALERSLSEIRRLRASEGKRRAAIEALVSAGELEAALADAADPLEEAVAQATDALAAVAIGSPVDLSVSAEALAHARAPRSLAIRPPEGFACGALHPQAYACVSELVDTPEALVIGVRSIGTTLSAVTAAALRARGVTARRLTVRPDGPPAHRRVTLGHEASEAIARARERGATVVVVDDVPGPNGSSFLATGEAVVAAGVPRERVVLLGGRQVDPDRLRPPSAGERWRAFRTAVAPSGVFAPVRSAALDVSGGAWRPLHYACAEHWPAVVEAMERRKLVAGGRLFKFEGLGSSGHAARHRASALAAEGIALDPCDEGDGWTSYPWGGRPMQAGDLDAALIEHIARYCARRPALCPLVSAETDLTPVVAGGVAVLLGGVSVAGSPLAELIAEGTLAVERVATTDSRLAPHEWLRMADGSVRKTDAIAHGDDPLFPGPTDIAWDLAGAIVEWEMDKAARERLLAAYRRASGDDAARRIDAWLVAYAAVRGAFNLFALETCGAAEARRLVREVERYRAVVASFLVAAPREPRGALEPPEPEAPESGRS